MIELSTTAIAAPWAPVDASVSYVSPRKFAAAPAVGLDRASLQKAFAHALNHRNRIWAKYDAAQTFTGNENHWANADHMDPHSVASLSVRRTLRSRSRYEIVENNPYLKGTVLSICNDFTGRGPKLKIRDKRFKNDRARAIQEKFAEWARIVKLRRKIWQLRMAKIVDGEAFMIPYSNKNRPVKYPILLDLQIIECDRVSDQNMAFPSENVGEIDGVRFDAYENALAYYVLYQHPGGSSLSNFALQKKANGKWIDAKYVIHWFRRDRGWLRGIPETSPSLPLCALLRRYTLATVRNREVVTDFTVLLESQLPANATPYTDGMGNLIHDDPFDVFPLEYGLAMTLPFGMTVKQLEGVPLGDQFDAFTGTLLREISRPLLVPFNIASGSSKDSNMASGVLDTYIYKGGQTSERYSCEEDVLDMIFEWWWAEAIRVPGYLSGNFRPSNDKEDLATPRHDWGWDEIGIEHTDPDKVATALKTLHDKRFLTDSDIQEGRFNRDVEDWVAEVEEDDKRRAKFKPVNAEDKPENQPKPAAPPGGKAKPKPKAKAAERRLIKTIARKISRLRSKHRQNGHPAKV